MNRATWIKAVLGTLILGTLVALLVLSPARDWFLTADGRHMVSHWLQARIDALGYWGPLVFILIYAVGCLFLIPATLFTTLGAILYGKYGGIPVNIVAAMVGAAVAFLGSRYLFRDFAQHFVGHRLDAWNERITKNGIWVVMWMRLCFLPFPVVNLGCALTQISFRDFMIGTFFSTLLPLAYLTYVLGSISELALANQSVSSFLRQDIWVIGLGLIFYLCLPKLFKWVTSFKSN